MPNTIDATGIQIQTVPEIVSEIADGTTDYSGMRTIYGAGINLDANSPDGQLVNIFAQAKRDALELIRDTFNSFDPDQAVGLSLDQRCAINGVARKAGTYTYVSVNITVSQAVTLKGIDSGDTPFTIANTAGTKFYLVETVSYVSPGTFSKVFRAATLGNVEAPANTLTVPVTVLLGVTSVNNPTGPTSLGVDAETDEQLRTRRAYSVAQPSTGFWAGLRGALLSLEGVTEAVVFENSSSSTDAYGIPAHSIWAVVAGGNIDEIAQVIYRRRNAGCGMKGTVEVDVVQAGSDFVSQTVTMKFDRPTAQDLWLKFTLTAISGELDADWIKAQILTNIKYSIGQSADTASIIAYIKSIAPNASVSLEGVSNNGTTWTTLLNPTGLNYQFALDAARITIL